MDGNKIIKGTRLVFYTELVKCVYCDGRLEIPESFSCRKGMSSDIRSNCKQCSHILISL